MSTQGHIQGVPARPICLRSPPTIVPDWLQSFQVSRPVSPRLGQRSGQTLSDPTFSTSSLRAGLGLAAFHTAQVPMSDLPRALTGWRITERQATWRSKRLVHAGCRSAPSVATAGVIQPARSTPTG